MGLVDKGGNSRDGIAVFGFSWWLVCLGMWTEGKVVSMVLCDGHFQHFLSLALLSLLGTIFAISSKVGLILHIFKDPPGILVVFCHV